MWTDFRPARPRSLTITYKEEIFILTVLANGGLVTDQSQVGHDLTLFGALAGFLLFLFLDLERLYDDQDSHDDQKLTFHFFLKMNFKAKTSFKIISNNT